MKLDNRYEVRIYIAPICNPEWMYDDLHGYALDYGSTPFITLFYIYDTETKMPADICETGDGYYETVEDAIKDYYYRIKK